MNNDELYQQFVEEYFTIGRSDIPPDWPTELRKRCSFFLRMLENGAKSDDNPTKGSSTAVSLMATLSVQGVRADISLSSPDQAPHLEQDELSEQAERYVFENELAKGGMGRILLAYDRDFRRRIAVKVLRQSSPGTGLVSRFLEEAQATEHHGRRLRGSSRGRLGPGEGPQRGVGHHGHRGDFDFTL